jgi:ribonuclease HI
MNVISYTDGGSRGNPGPAGIGAVLYAETEEGHKGEILAEISEYLGETTNNVAEYTALEYALLKAKEIGAVQVHCFLDS